MKIFRDRSDAGQKLAEKLRGYELSNALVVALPRGGVPVTSEIARLLQLPWDVVLVKKIGAPNHPEFAIGALSEDHMPVWNEEVIALLSLKDRELAELAETSKIAIQKQHEMWKSGFAPMPFEGKHVILVDDGLATGLTMQAAIQLLKRKGVSKMTIAVPVSPGSTIESLKPMVDDVICLEVPEHFLSVGEWYEDFAPVSSEFIANSLHGRLPGSGHFNESFASTF